MIKISSIGKYLDQPLLTAKLNKKIPTIMTVGAGAYGIGQVINAPKEKKRKTGIKSAIILVATVFSAIKAPKIASYLTGRKMSKNVETIISENRKNIDNLLKNNSFSKKITKLMNKSKNKILSIKEIDFLNKNLEKKVIDRIVPPPKDITSKDIFKEIGWLSIYGAIPVAGGIVGGIGADMATEKDWKKRVPNKIKEGTYQYLANIFLCNVGAGAALGILEHKNIKSKAARCAGMIGGILLTGVIGGSVIANYIGNKLINPMLSKNNKKDYRTPELLDLGLHTDDIATVSLMSGLKWIEPSLPILYSISGYRAGIGYRNSKNSSNNQPEIKKESFKNKTKK